MVNNLNAYEKLIVEAEDENIIVKEMDFNSDLDGLYFNNKIAINKKLSSIAEKTCILAEEIGHHHKNIGNILLQDTVDNVKQEQKAREYAYNKLVSIDKLVAAFSKNLRTTYEISDYLDVTEAFLLDAIEYYKAKYGIKVLERNGHFVQFVPYFLIFKQL